MNKVLLTGRLTRDPEMRVTAGGKAVTTFNVATHEYAGHGKEKSEFHTIVTWDRLAVICGRDLGKGQQVAVEGRIQTRTWDDDTGKRHWRTEIVAGQVDNCGWLQITTASGVEGWVSGSSQYVTLDVRCADIPEADAPAAPASGGSTSGGQSSGGGQASSGNATQGCYLFQNQIGPELTITFTNKDSGKSESFKVPGSGEVEKCFAPGRYTYTLDAPPPWGSTNGELTVEAGDVFLFPITPQ